MYEIHGKTVLQKDFAIPYAIIQFDARRAPTKPGSASRSVSTLRVGCATILIANFETVISGRIMRILLL